MLWSLPPAFSQKKEEGIIAGNVVSPDQKALPEVTAELVLLPENKSHFTRTDKEGLFAFAGLANGYYQLRLSYAGMQPLIIDSIHIRDDRKDFNLPDLALKPGTDLQEVIVFSEKPLIESKDGNITFNASESAFAAGSTASELLATVPLVSKDADGKINVRGKEPKILIDDKPVELNMQQLQDLLESMPGSTIEKIEIMTNPPPQYANEQGGVINIITRKGKVGKTGRISLAAGTRGEMNVNGNFSYRKKGLVFNLNAGAVYNRIGGMGYSIRENIYTDSSNLFTTSSHYRNRSVRPQVRASLDYDITASQSLSAMLQLNAGDIHNRNKAVYRNINRFAEIYRLNERSTSSTGNNGNALLNLSYLLRLKRPGEQLRIIASANRSVSKNDRLFYQQYFHPDYTPTGRDSTQQQNNTSHNDGYTVRINYNRPLFNGKTTLSAGGHYIRHNSLVQTDAAYFDKTGDSWIGNEQLSNHFHFHQTTTNLRLSLKQRLGERFTASAGIAQEQTYVWFELFDEQRNARNNYGNWLPFFTINKSWEDNLTLNLSYRRTIRRPGINEMNPTVDFSDPYNIRFGNERLQPAISDNFDIVAGRTSQHYYFNIGVGYNRVKDIFSRVRTLLEDGKTQLTWENISGRSEYELSGWAGYTFSRKLRANMSLTYLYSRYSAFDKETNRFRNGGTFTSNLTTVFSPTDKWNFTARFGFNRFASPQGFSRWNYNMQTGMQYKMMNKRLVATLDITDPFTQQRNRSFTHGTHFNLESFNTTNTRNFRLTLAYNIIPVVKKNPLTRLRS